MKLDVQGNKNHFRASILPEGMDAQDIGTSENRWRSAYIKDLQASSASILNITASVTATGSTTSRLLSDRFNDINSVKDYGAVGDGIADDTTAIQAAINANLGRVLIPPGKYRVTAPLVLTRAITISGIGGGPSSLPANSGAETKSIIQHDFSGDLFTITGVNGDVNASSGYVIENLLLQQINGNGTGAKGKAINAVWTSATFVPTWIRLRNLNIEIAVGADEWTNGIYLDGSTSAANELRDIWIDNSRIFIGTNGIDAIHIINAANVYVNQCELNGTNGNFAITGSSGKLATSIVINGGGGVTLALDFAQSVSLFNGGWTTITNTANTAGKNILFPGRLTNAFTNNAVLTTDVVQFQVFAEIPGGNFNQALNVGTPVIFKNGNNGGIGALNAAGTSYLRIVQLDGSNRLQLGLDAGDILWGKPLVATGAGGAATLGQVGGSGPTTNAQNTWMRVVDNTGATFWVPAWK